MVFHCQESGKVIKESLCAVACSLVKTEETVVRFIWPSSKTDSYNWKNMWLFTCKWIYTVCGYNTWIIVLIFDFQFGNLQALSHWTDQPVYIYTEDTQHLKHIIGTSFTFLCVLWFHQP